MSDSVRPHRRQPTRLPHPWDSPDKNIGVGCHFFLQCMKVKSESEVAQSCPTLSDPMDCSLPGSSIHGIFQAPVTRVGYQWWKYFIEYCSEYQHWRESDIFKLHFFPLLAVWSWAIYFLYEDFSIFFYERRLILYRMWQRLNEIFCT